MWCVGFKLFLLYVVIIPYEPLFLLFFQNSIVMLILMSQHKKAVFSLVFNIYLNQPYRAHHHVQHMWMEEWLDDLMMEYMYVCAVNSKDI